MPRRTGHGLQYLRMPRSARDAFGAGLVRREADKVVRWLSDPKRTAISLVTTAEEMPVNETITMAASVRDELEMPLGALFVNRLHTERFREADLEALRASASRSRKAETKMTLEHVASRAAEETGWSQLNKRYLRELGRGD